MRNEEFLKYAEEVSKNFLNISTKWDGKNAILEMKNSNFNQWKQMKWIGFYFQFICQKILRNIFQIPGPKYSNVEFDGFYKIPWDFKAHAINTSSHQIIVNDKEAIEKAIIDYHTVGLILAMGEVKYNDEKRTFQKWHEELKGGKSKYELERIQRGAWSRLRKVEFNLKQISFIKIDKTTLLKSGSFQRDFRNADGSPRREKVLLDLEKLNEEILYFLNF
ncbi:MAG: hypothetical protein QW757_03075 [Candidatus Woesearchaeota archaeon]